MISAVNLNIVLSVLSVGIKFFKIMKQFLYTLVWNCKVKHSFKFNIF